MLGKPCHNIVEEIRITLSGDEQLIDYAFTKQSCGQAIGVESLLLDHLRGLAVDEILAFDEGKLLAAGAPLDDTDRFLHLKHLFAIQDVLQVYVGRDSGGKSSRCAVAKIHRENDTVVIDADINIELVAEKIIACADCHGACGYPKISK